MELKKGYNNSNEIYREWTKIKSPRLARAAKQAIPNQPSPEGFKRENDAWYSLVMQPAAAQLMGDGLANGLQTREGELQLENILRSVNAVK